METVLRLGAINLGQQELVVVKSVLKLRSTHWTWSEATQGADLWLVDIDREGYAAQVAGLERQRLVALAAQAGAAEQFAHWLIKPIKAVHMLRLLETVTRVLAPSGVSAAVALPAQAPVRAELQTPTVVAASVAVAASAAVDIDLTLPEPAAPIGEIPAADAAHADAHPWRGRKVLLAKSPNLAKFPVSAEMLPWLDELRRAPVGYEELLAALPMDAAMIDSILDEAAKAGDLRDRDGNSLPPLPRRSGSGFWGRFKK